MRQPPLRKLKATNFRSLADVEVDFGPLSVLVGPNGSGKSNLLKVLSFVRDTARFNISQAINQMGGFHHVLRDSDDASSVSLTIEGTITEHARSRSKDSYTLELSRSAETVDRQEEFIFKRKPGAGRRYTIRARGQEISVTPDAGLQRETQTRLASSDISALGALARVSDETIGDGPEQFFSFLSGIRYLDPNVSLARRPTGIAATSIADDSSNLSSALHTLYERAPGSFQDLLYDLRRCLPGLENITFEPVGGTLAAIVVRLHERGLSSPIDLADASFGTVRLLALLVALHEEDPPALTIVEEIDHGLHPYALDVLVDRMRIASERTQIIVASHSPTLVNRLEPSEIIICDRDPETAESIIPVHDPEDLSNVLEGSDWKAGELWFSGALGGVPR